MLDMKNPESYTRYERTRIIAARALQIARGAPVLVKAPKNVTKAVDLARLEFEAGVIPIEIKK